MREEKPHLPSAPPRPTPSRHGGGGGGALPFVSSAPTAP